MLSNDRIPVLSNSDLASLKAAGFSSSLSDLETTIERASNSTRFYTPSAPIIGLNSHTQATAAGPTTSIPQYGGANVFEAQDLIDDEDEEDFIDEYQDMASGDGSDVMDELEDSTEAP
mmetsp:Transcript_85416/g.167137  ORF Transcript_85416/g.167137 Transcript_85416/m.167137 type:complete len:118 (+) Transcript_85416:97-450(+)